MRTFALLFAFLLAACSAVATSGEALYVVEASGGA